MKFKADTGRPKDLQDIYLRQIQSPHEIAQLRSFAQWPLWEKLEWPESAQIRAESLEKSRVARENQEK